MELVNVFFLLLFAHALADYPLQGDFLSKAKNRTAVFPGVPWYQAMGAHSVIHGGFVYVITGSATLGMLEVVAHFIIDDLKCQDEISFNMDQGLHMVCKVIWVCFTLAFPTLY